MAKKARNQINAVAPDPVPEPAPAVASEPVQEPMASVPEPVPEPVIPVEPPPGPCPNVILERQHGGRLELYHPRGAVGQQGRPFCIAYPEGEPGQVMYFQSEIRDGRWIYRSRD